MAAQIFNLGKLRFTYKGTYSGSTEYQLNDVVKYLNDIYVYTNQTPTTSNLPTNETYWSKMLEGFTDPTAATPGQFITSDGTNYAFASINQVPSQATHAGKLLYTNGTTVTWEDSVPTFTFDGDVNNLGGLLVGTGVDDYSNLGTYSATVQSKSLTDDVATITFTAPHNFFPFQFVTVALSPADPTFDGEQEITDITSNTISFAKVASNVGSTAASGAVSAIPGYTNAVAAFGVDADDYAQIAFRNASNAAAASTDILMYANNGTDFSGWIDMGITSSGFNDPEFTITGPNDGYIFMSAPAGTTGSGNLVLATDETGTDNKIIFAAGGLSSNNTQMEITPDVNVHIEIATPSTSSTTGALTVVGGVGVQGDMNIEGSVNIVGDLVFGGGSTTTENLQVTSPLVFTGDGNETDSLDLGLVGEYTSSGTKYAGVVRDASDGIIKFFQGATTKPTTTVNFSEGGLDYADIQVRGITASGSISLSGTVDIQEMRETVVSTAISANAIAADWSAGNIFWVTTTPGANFTVNLTNVPTDNDRVMTVNVFVTQGATGYIPNALSVNGSGASIKWANGSAPTATSITGRIDVFTFTLVRLSGAWTVLGSANLNWG